MVAVDGPIALHELVRILVSLGQVMAVVLCGSFSLTVGQKREENKGVRLAGNRSREEFQFPRKSGLV